MPARVRCVLRCAIMLILCGPVLALAASAQSTSEADGYAGESQGYAGQFGEVLAEIDMFWSAIFAAEGLAYRSPDVVAVDRPMQTACGSASPQNFASYCTLDETIYYSPQRLGTYDVKFGDFAPIVVMAHEWGHHVQQLTNTERAASNAFELQADCFAGAYANEAGQRGRLDPGDITEAVAGSAEAGDPLGLPQDRPGAHGINDDRVTAFMRGYLDGVTRCGWQLAAVPQPPSPAREPAGFAISTLLPTTLELAQGQPFRLESEGVSTFAEMVSGLPNPEFTRQMLSQWGWQENVYRIYASDAPPPNAVGWLSLGVHRFDSVDGAAAGLSYFAESRRESLGLTPVDVGLFADQTEAFAGQAVNGRELVIYARRGNLVFRADGIAPNGDPTADVFEALLIPLRQLVDEPGVVSPALFDLLPQTADVGRGLTITEEHARSAGTIAATFPNVAEAERLFQDWGWRESAARVFTGDAPGGTSRLEVSVFRFADEQAAAAALPYFLAARAEALRLSSAPSPLVQADESQAVFGAVEENHEATVYLRRGSYLYRVTAVGEGDPMVDLAQLFARW